MKILQKTSSRSTEKMIAICFLLLLTKVLLSVNYPAGIEYSPPPTITCPGNMTVNNDPGVCYAVVYYTAPEGATQTAGYPSGSQFQVGVTTNTFELDDETCSFTITVVDNEPPVLNCPDNIIENATSGLCQIVEYDLPTALDNCDGALDVELVSGPESGDIFPVGTTTVTYSATDSHNNTGTCSFTVTISGSNSPVLPFDGTTSGDMTPQGGLNYQRSFYLIRPDEMSLSELETGDIINSIGFVNGVAQDITTTGNIKIYLENTNDTSSRYDSDWIEIPAVTSPYNLTGLEVGDYEWQIQSDCGNTDIWSDSSLFATADPSKCHQPYNLQTTNITSTSARLQWESYEIEDFSTYEVSYKLLSDQTWPSPISVSTTQYDIPDLSSGSTYQWRVRGICGPDDTKFTSSVFTTALPSGCEAVTGLSSTVKHDTAFLTWTPLAAEDYYYYSIFYRRKGASDWLNLISLNNNTFISKLENGAIYEWKVKVICKNNDVDNEGTFSATVEFTADGTSKCYKVQGLKASEITTSSAKLSWMNTPSASSYNLRYRLRESITWDNAIEGMTEVSNAQFTIPDKKGIYTIPFEGGTEFTYDGGGLYIAIEYFSDGGTLSEKSSALCTKSNTWLQNNEGADSYHRLLGFYGKTTKESSSLPTVLKSIDTRPETHFGSSAFVDVLEVSSVYTKGFSALPFGGAIPLSAFVRNYSSDDLTVNVTLNIYEKESGNLVHTEIISQLVEKSCGEFVSFADWTDAKLGDYQIVVSVPNQTGENITENNLCSANQKIGRIIESYADESPAITGAGAGTAGGLILSKFSLEGCGMINSVRVFLTHTSENHSVSAVILNSSGAILENSEAFVPSESDVNAYHTFYFQNPPTLKDENYYIGLSQSSSADEYFPVGVQWEGSIVRSNAYFRAAPDGTNITDTPEPGRLMIHAEVLPAMATPFISGSDVLCNGEPNTLTAGSKTIRYANKVNAVSSEISGPGVGAVEALGSPDVYPATNAGKGVWSNGDNQAKRAWIVLEFPDPDPINYIEIFETVYPGSIDSVYIYDNDGNKIQKYSGTATVEPNEASKTLIQFDETLFDVSKIRISMNNDTTLTIQDNDTTVYNHSGLHAIDAVAIGLMKVPGEYESYFWTPLNETSQSVTIDEEDKYQLTVTNANGCVWSDSMEVIIPEPMTPTITASGPTSFCEGDTVILYSNIEKDITWSTGSTADSIIVTTSGTYSVSYNNGCQTTTSSAKTITVYSPPSAEISGGPICQGETETLTAESNFESYLWSTGQSTSSITVSQPGNYYVTVEDEHGCFGTSMVTAFYAPVPHPVISGDPFFCPGKSTTLSADAAYNSYLWTNETTGATISAAREISVTSVYLVSLTVTNEFECTGTDQVMTGAYPAPQPFISGTLALCSGSSTVLDAGSEYYDYKWSNGATTHSIIVDTADTYTVSIIDYNGCAGSASATTTMDGMMPGTPDEIDGPMKGICNAEGLIYSIEPVNNAEYYVWKLPENMTIVSGQGTTNIQVNATAPVNGPIIVAASNKCGQSPAWNGRAMLVDGSPAKPEQILGMTAGVCSSTREYSVTEIFGASDYSWTVPAGAEIISGNGTKTVTVLFGPNFTSGQICVHSINDCGISDDQCLSVSGPPSVPGTINGPIAVCNKQKNVTYSIVPVSGATSYQWSVPLQATIISGQGSISIVVNFGNKSGNISVKAINSCGQSQISQLYVAAVNCRGSDTFTFVIDPNNSGYNIYGPDWNYAWGEQVYDPEVIASAGGFDYAGGNTVAWTLGEPVISSIDDNIYLLTQGFHQGYFIINESETGLENVSITIYPVPAKEYVNIRMVTKSYPVDILLEIFDMMGNKLFTDRTEFSIYNHSIPLVNFSTGMMILKVTDVNNHKYGSYKIIRVR
ncbi:MAG TPA: HYR domain-containing protein [Lentimicrobium sp.]|nr:HYR domain-containing protein [Lentimicrobium sp.]